MRDPLFVEETKRWLDRVYLWRAVGQHFASLTTIGAAARHEVRGLLVHA
jgi:hypothetical protein